MLAGRFPYTAREQVDVAALRKRITGPLPTGVSIDDVVGKVRSMAEELYDHGNFKSWALVIEAAIAALGPSTMDFDFAPFTPSWSGDSPPGTPPVSEYTTFGRRLSGEFSTLFEAEIGFDTATARSSTVKLVHDDTAASGVTCGPGRFQTNSGKKVLGETVYSKFVPKLPTLSGLSEAEVAQALLDGLLDDVAFRAILADLEPDQQEALTKTVRLLNNEIIHRSSVNLLTITGVLKRCLVDSSKTISVRFQTEGLFAPVGKEHKYNIGGQQLSRSHWPGSTALDRADAELTGIHHAHRQAIGNLAKSNAVDLDGVATACTELFKKYVENLQEYWRLEITG